MRTGRIVHPGYPHHVMLRGNNRRRLFSYATDYQRFLWDTKRGLQACAVTMQALVIMANHVHLVVTPESKEALSSFVKFVAQRYAVFRNRKRGGSGKLFEERYRSEPILTESYYVVVIPYVELNPVRAGRAAAPQDYPWSTYRLHTGRESDSVVDPALWTPAQWYLDLSVNSEKRAQRYADWVGECYESKLRSEHAEAIRQTEARTTEKYGLRLERPDRKRVV